MMRFNQTDARIMLIQTIPRVPTPVQEFIGPIDRKFDWEKSVIYEEFLKEKNIKYYKDNEGFF